MLIKTKKKKKKKTIKCRDSSLHLYPTTNGYLAGRRELYKTVWASSSSARILRGIFFLLLKELKRNEKRKSQKTHQQKHEVHTIAQSKAPFFLLHHRQMIVISVEREWPFSCLFRAVLLRCLSLLFFFLLFPPELGKHATGPRVVFFFFLLFRIPPPKSLPIWILMALLLFSIIYLPPPPPLWICCALYARPESIISNQINNEAHGSDRVISWARPVGTTDSSRPKKKVART